MLNVVNSYLGNNCHQPGGDLIGKSCTCSGMEGSCAEVNILEIFCFL